MLLQYTIEYVFHRLTKKTQTQTKQNKTNKQTNKQKKDKEQIPFSWGGKMQAFNDATLR